MNPSPSMPVGCSLRRGERAPTEISARQTFMTGLIMSRQHKLVVFKALSFWPPVPFVLGSSIGRRDSQQFYRAEQARFEQRSVRAKRPVVEPGVLFRCRRLAVADDAIGPQV